MGMPPLVLVVNSTHLVRDDHDGQDLLEMFQQRTEQWAASGLVTTGKFPVLNAVFIHLDRILIWRKHKKCSTAMTIGYMNV